MVTKGKVWGRGGDWAFRMDTYTSLCLKYITTEDLLFSAKLDLIFCSNLKGEGNGTPLQYSCLENPMDGGAW